MPDEIVTKRRKDSDNENDRQNGLRIRNEKEKLKEKRFSFFADPKEGKRYANAQLAHCLLPDTQANPPGKSHRAVSANSLLRNDVSYPYCQVCPDCFTINNNFFDKLRQFTQLSFVSLQSSLT